MVEVRILAGQFPTPERCITIATDATARSPDDSEMDPSLAAIILAAGKGTRMDSDLPKVAHPVASAPMVTWVAQACREAGCARLVLIVGHRQEVVRDLFNGASGHAPAIEFVLQGEQRGTGHAVRCAEPTLAGHAGDVLVLAGDGPLVRAESLRALVERHRATDAVLTLATAVVDDPAGYGRIVRDEAGRFTGVVEEREATSRQRAIREINPSVYCFNSADLFEALPRLAPSASSGEYYLTDVPALLAADGKRIDAINSLSPAEALSINTPEQLEAVDRILTARLADAAGG